MADNKNITPAEENKKSVPRAKKPNVLSNLGKKIAKFCKDTVGELKKVVWPSRKQVVNNTLIVIAVVLIIGIIIWAFDALFQFGIFRFLQK